MSRASARPLRWLSRLAVLCVGVAVLSGCSAHAAVEATATPHPVTASEAGRLANVEFNAYRDKVLAVTGTVVDANGPVRLTGWVNTVDRTGYALVSPQNGTPFLTAWNTGQVAAQNAPAQASTPPLPRPKTGWSSTDLTASDSALSAAQLVLISIGKDRPDNPQLLMRNGARWLKSAHLGTKVVDVIAGPLAEGATVSNLRYWVDHTGHLLRLRARLDGHDWSTFDFTPAPSVTF